jgi:hypothetical protein
MDIKFLGIFTWWKGVSHSDSVPRLSPQESGIDVYKGYRDHLDVILTIENPLTIFQSEDWKRAFGLFDMVLSFLFIPFAMTLFIEFTLQRLRAEMMNNLSAKVNKKIAEHVGLVMGKCAYCGEDLEFDESKGRAVGKCKNNHTIPSDD